LKEQLETNDELIEENNELKDNLFDQVNKYDNLSIDYND